MLKTLTLKEVGTVGFGGNHKGKIIVTWLLVIILISINNVRLVDELKHNLLNINQFCDSGYKVMFNKNYCTLISDSDKSIVFTRKRKDNVYKINFSELTDQNIVCLLLMSDEKWLWHRRL